MDFTDLTRLAGGFAEARAIQAAVKLGLFDALAGGNLDTVEVASRLQTDPRATEVLLNALAAIGILGKNDRRFSLTPVSATYLVQTSPRYLGGMILFDASLWDAWGRLEETVRSGLPPRAPDMFQGRPEETGRFIAAMHSLVEARGDAAYLAENLDFEGVKELLDVGSGPGTYPVHFCRRVADLRVTIFDLPGTLEITEEIIAGSGVEDRITLHSGDYRVDPLPGGFQMAFLSNIIHGESGEENERLVGRLHGALEPGGRIVIKDHILDDGKTHPPVGAVFSLLMLLTTAKGRCYSFSEVKGWLEKTGFGRIAEIPLPSPPFTSSLVVAEKAR